MKRKIAVILAAGIDRYKEHVARDEDATLVRLAAARAVLEDGVRRHDGRIFNAAGDAVLAEFASAVEAVRCAADVQRRLRAAELAAASGAGSARAGSGSSGSATAGYGSVGTSGPGVSGPGTAGLGSGGRGVGASAAKSAAARFTYRMGISIGDVVLHGGDLLGDGVNVAARLQGVASGDGICVSRAVVEHVAAKLPLCFVDAGLHTLKNMPEPVHAYMVDLDGKPSGLPSRAPARGGLMLPVLALAVVALVGGAAYVLLDRQHVVATTSVTPAAPGTSAEPAPSGKVEALPRPAPVARGVRCAEILERAQLGRLSAADRQVLQSECH